MTVLLLTELWATGDVHAQIGIEEEVSFRSGDVTLYGTVLVPEASGKRPAIVLVHGAGLGRRDENRTVAEALVNEGMVTFIYDKRTQGYSASPVGDRSYPLLADDVVAAVQMLQQRAYVNPAQVGLWGFSEGGWVAPLAASRSSDVAFVITVAGGGIGPAEQSAWATEGALRRRGVMSDGTLRALTDRAYRFLVSADLFAEGMYDPVPVLEQISQPILGIWGALDRVMPPAASARAMQNALERGGNQHYVLRVIPKANHAGYATPDEQTTPRGFAPGYIETISSWIRDVTAGNPPGPSVGKLPIDEYPTRPSVTDLQGFARWQVQLGFFALFHLTFGPYVVAAGVRRLKARKARLSPTQRSARTTASLGLVIPWGVYIVVGYVSGTSGEGVAAVVVGRPVAWFVLQILAGALVFAAVSLGVAWYRGRQQVSGSERFRIVLLLVGTFLFVPWAYWWQLFSV